MLEEEVPLPPPGGVSDSSGPAARAGSGPNGLLRAGGRPGRGAARGVVDAMVPELPAGLLPPHLVVPAAAYVVNAAEPRLEVRGAPAPPPAAAAPNGAGPPRGPAPAGEDRADDPARYDGLPVLQAAPGAVVRHRGGFAGRSEAAGAPSHETISGQTREVLDALLMGRAVPFAPAARSPSVAPAAPAAPATPSDRTRNAAPAPAPPDVATAGPGALRQIAASAPPPPATTAPPASAGPRGATTDAKDAVAPRPDGPVPGVRAAADPRRGGPDLRAEATERLRAEIVALRAEVGRLRGVAGRQGAEATAGLTGAIPDDLPGILAASASLRDEIEAMGGVVIPAAGGAPAAVGFAPRPLSLWLWVVVLGTLLGGLGMGLLLAGH